MSESLIVIDSVAGINELVSYLEDKEYVFFDVETTGLNDSDTIIGYSVCAEETKAFYIITHKWNVKTQTLDSILDKDASILPIRILETKKLVAHNAVFDCKMIRSNYGVSLIESIHTDTMVMAHLTDENRRVGLKELAKQYFGETSTAEQNEMKESIIQNGGKLTKSDYELYKGDAYLIAKYGAKDALLTFKVFYKLLEELFDQGLETFFYQDESMPLLKGPTYQLNTIGLKVDQKALTMLKKQLEAECAEAKEFIHSEIKEYIKDKYPGTTKANTFNIGSNQQLAWLLFGKYGLEFGSLTKGGKTVCKALGQRAYTRTEKNKFVQCCQDQVGHPYQLEAIVNGKKVKAKKISEPWKYIAVDKKVLTKLAPKYKWIQRLLEYQRKTKLLNTYVKGIEERVQYGIIRPSFLQTGTTSGRYSSRNPNFQNLPRDDKRIKSCIVSRPGKVFVGADYSQLEARIFAYFSGDQRLLESFKGTDDFYSVIGMEIYEKYDCLPKKEGSPDAFGLKYKKLRDLSKTIALAVTYGATAYQLAPVTGKTVEDTQKDIDNYFERFPRVREMMLESHKMAKTTGQVTNLFGRPRRLPDAMKIEKLFGTGDLPYEARNILNLSVNHRMQSTAASICNRAMIQFTVQIKESGIENCHIVLQVHDEIVVECDEKDAENVAVILRKSMENTVNLKTVTLPAIPRIAKNLGDLK